MTLQILILLYLNCKFKKKKCKVTWDNWARILQCDFADFVI